MTRPLIYGIYEQAAVGVGGSPSFWTHPLDERLRIDRLPFWADLARTAEQGGLDLLFFGDVLGLYEGYRGGHEGAVEWAVEAPANDPSIHISALVGLTESLGFGLTASTTYEHPFAFARRLSTLDHLSEGRVGWNIVTSYLENAARNFGLDTQIGHDSRYDRAEEFLDVVYKLWEGSWADDAIVASKEQRIFARGDRVRAIDHRGEHYRVAGPHLTTPSPQRTPALFQAGWSPRGQRFGAKHAEVVFVGQVAKPEQTRRGLENIRRLAGEEFGREGDDIRALAAVRIVTGRTPIEAQEHYDSLQANYHLEAQLVSYAGDTGIDLSAYADDEPVVTESQGFASNIVDGEGRPLTAGQLREQFSRISRGADDALFFGSGEQVADQLEAYVARSGVDGFLLAQYITPGTVDGFLEHVAPELEKRGLLDPAPKSGTLRSRLRADGADRLPEHAWGARYRFPDTPA